MVRMRFGWCHLASIWRNMRCTQCTRHAHFGYRRIHQLVTRSARSHQIDCNVYSFMWAKEIINTRCEEAAPFSPLTFFVIYRLRRSSATNIVPNPIVIDAAVLHMDRKDLTRTNRFCSLLIFETFAHLLIRCRNLHTSIDRRIVSLMEQQQSHRQ